MESLNIDVNELLKLDEDNLIMMITPGRMWGDDYIFVYKKDNQFFEYYIDYCDEIFDVFPNRTAAFENPNYYEKMYYKDNDYFIIDLGFGCHAFIKNEYVIDFIYNAKPLLEQEHGHEYNIDEILRSGSELCGCLREAVIKTLS